MSSRFDGVGLNRVGELNSGGGRINLQPNTSTITVYHSFFG